MYGEERWRNSSTVCAGNNQSVWGWRGGEHAQNSTVQHIDRSQCDAWGSEDGDGIAMDQAQPMPLLLGAGCHRLPLNMKK